MTTVVYVSLMCTNVRIKGDILINLFIYASSYCEIYTCKVTAISSGPTGIGLFVCLQSEITLKGLSTVNVFIRNNCSILILTFLPVM